MIDMTGKWQDPKTKEWHDVIVHPKKEGEHSSKQLFSVDGKIVSWSDFMKMNLGPALETAHIVDIKKRTLTWKDDSNPRIYYFIAGRDELLGSFKVVGPYAPIFDVYKDGRVDWSNGEPGMTGCGSREADLTPYMREIIEGWLNEENKLH